MVCLGALVARTLRLGALMRSDADAPADGSEGEQGVKDLLPVPHGQRALLEELVAARRPASQPQNVARCSLAHEWAQFPEALPTHGWRSGPWQSQAVKR